MKGIIRVISKAAGEIVIEREFVSKLMYNSIVAECMEMWHGYTLEITIRSNA